METKRARGPVRRVSGLFWVTFPLVTSFDAREESFRVYVTDVELRREVDSIEVNKRASASVLWLEQTARRVCAAMSSGSLVDPDAAGRAPQVLRDYFAPGAPDATRRRPVKFSHFGGATQSMDESWANFDLL